MSSDKLVFLDFSGDAIVMTDTDGGNKQVCIDTLCARPDGLALQIPKVSKPKVQKKKREGKKGRKAADKETSSHHASPQQQVLVFWDNMGEPTPAPEERDKFDFHRKNGYLCVADLFIGNASARKLPTKRPLRLVNLTSERLAEHAEEEARYTRAECRKPITRKERQENPVVDEGLITTSKQLAVTRDGKSIFFSDREGHVIKKYNVDTQEVVPLVYIHEVIAAQRRRRRGGDSANGNNGEVQQQQQQQHQEDEGEEAGAGETSTEEPTRVPEAVDGCEPNSDDDKKHFCVGMALDEAHNYIYFTVKGPSKAGCGAILAAPYHFRTNNVVVAPPPTTTEDDTEGEEGKKKTKKAAKVVKPNLPEGVIPPECVLVLKEHLPEPIDLLIDPVHHYLYWTDRGDDAMGGNSLNRATLKYFSNRRHRDAYARKPSAHGEGSTVRVCCDAQTGRCVCACDGEGTEAGCGCCGGDNKENDGNSTAGGGCCGSTCTCCCCCRLPVPVNYPKLGKTHEVLIRGFHEAIGLAWAANAACLCSCGPHDGCACGGGGAAVSKKKSKAKASQTDTAATSEATTLTPTCACTKASGEAAYEYMYVTDIGGAVYRCHMAERTKELVYQSEHGSLTGIDYLCVC